MNDIGHRESSCPPSNYNNIDINNLKYSPDYGITEEEFNNAKKEYERIQKEMEEFNNTKDETEDVVEDTKDVQQKPKIDNTKEATRQPRLVVFV
ncbi:hypothetical protein PBRA_008402 [Plasmodiophora brassicae]|uniref:Uncharacterized protein n=1 Tax=Plasmodiophora brassicae TaxID=37360 RepID=A0A0G4J0H3_PLABS|nr:hypothetical protein PBRA_008402 [Plasmodiophora brassicae]